MPTGVYERKARPEPRKQQTSVENLARNAPVAAALKTGMAEKSLTSGDLGKLLNPKSTNPQSLVGRWLRGDGVPNPVYQTKLAKILGQPKSAFQPLSHKATPQDQARARALVRNGARTPAVPMPGPVRSADVLQFQVLTDGTARLRLDLVLDLPRASALLRMVLDAGVVMPPPIETLHQSQETAP